MRRPALLALGLAIAAGPAASHEWYPYACCASHDCFELPDGEVEATAGGWRVRASGEVIPYDRARTTPPEGGGKFHRCTIGGTADGQTIGSSYPKACIWTPAQGG